MSLLTASVVLAQHPQHALSAQQVLVWVPSAKAGFIASLASGEYDRFYRHQPPAL
jgi:hypothetical protein